MVTTLNRVIDVFVRDRRGQPIHGAAIDFTVDGVSAGSVANSEGRGRIELPERTRLVAVSATYEGVTQHVTLSQEQDAFTFHFDVDVAPESIMERHIALIVGLALAAVAIALAFVFGHPTALQTQIIRGTFSLAGGAIATEISGMINVNLTLGSKLTIAATGALAIFVILFFFVPA